jgi:phosphoribosyl-ATP pyrophosphohydrolase
MFTKLLKKVKEESFETQNENKQQQDSSNNDLKLQSSDVINFNILFIINDNDNLITKVIDILSIHFKDTNSSKISDLSNHELNSQISIGDQLSSINIEVIFS